MGTGLSGAISTSADRIAVGIMTVVKLRDHQRGLVISGAVAFLALVGFAGWIDRGFGPATAFALILVYFVAIALWGIVILLRRIALPPLPSDTPPPTQMSPAGVPVGPRRPSPLVARAIPQ